MTVNVVTIPMTALTTEHMIPRHSEHVEDGVSWFKVQGIEIDSTDIHIRYTEVNFWDLSSENYSVNEYGEGTMIADTRMMVQVRA